MANIEDQTQAAIVGFIHAVAPQCLVFAVPNGGLRTKAQAAKFKWTGVLAGVPDLVVLAPGGKSFFIEVKAPKGVLSDAQKALIPTIQNMGFPCFICRSVDDVSVALAALGIETREAA